MTLSPAGNGDGLAAPESAPRWVTGYLFAAGRMIPRVAARPGMRDILSGWKMRWNIGRSNYRVVPGIYAVGNPGRESTVLVTANYKLSFDALRKELTGLDAWILVLDTKGVNVWCAAGKGTFGTQELLKRLDRVHLCDIVSHRELILPQLGATGVAAHEVQKASGFRVIWGPVRAADLPRFLSNGRQKDDRMSRVEFPLGDRLAVAPVELSQAWPLILGALAVSGIAAAFLGAGVFPKLLLALGSPILVGTLLFPALLPVLPFRAFALKGAVLALAWNAGVALLLAPGSLWTAALLLTMTPLAAFLALNFTGATTYTNLRGTRREVSIGLPVMAVTGTIGLVLALAAAIAGR